jgi:hypothetical protein
MRRKLAVGLSVFTALTLMAGCSKPAPVNEPPPVKEPAPPIAAVPAPCTPGTTAVDLEAARSGGSGLTILALPGGQEPTAEHPRALYIAVNQTETLPGGGTAHGEIYSVRPGTAVISTGETVLRGAVTPAPPGGWLEQHTTIEGVQAAPRFFNNGGEYSFELRVPPGKAGESVTVIMRDVLLADGKAGDMQVGFCRQEPPRATLSYQRAGGSMNWLPATTYLPAGGALKLRIAFTAEMDRTTVERSLRQSKAEIGAIEWVDGSTAVVSIPSPGPVIGLNIFGALSGQGLHTVGGLPYLYTGEPARLEAVTPGTGQAHTIAQLPPEVQSAEVLPGGKAARVFYLRMRGGYESWPWGSPLEVNLKSGESREVPLESVELPPGVPEGAAHYLSPDGSRLALLVPVPDSSTEYHPYRLHRLSILDADGTVLKAFADPVRLYQPGKDGLRLFGPAWSPDSSRIAFTQDDPDGTPAVLIADVATGTLRTLARGAEGLHRGSADPLSWSPDGRRLLVGSLLLNAETGQIERRLAAGSLPVRWSPDGAWILGQDEPWAAVTAVETATGRSVALGDGLAAGWTADGRALVVRWDNARYRTIPFGI